MLRVRAAAVVVQEGAILLVRHRKDDQEYFLLPGGGVEPGETPEQALIRELAEETGLRAQPGRLLFETESISPDRTRRIQQQVFLCEADGCLMPGEDHRLAGAEFVGKSRFANLTFYPNIKYEILQAWDRDFNVAFRCLDVPWED
ncbi:MAG: NUDIX hydrolase [Fibrobacterota bacterium]